MKILLLNQSIGSRVHLCGTKNMTEAIVAFLGSRKGGTAASELQWTLYGRYFTAGGHMYCSLNEVLYCGHYMEGSSQLVDTGIAAWMKCVTVNIIWKVLHSSWRIVLLSESIVFGEHYMEGTSYQVDECIAAWTKCVTVKIKWITGRRRFVNLFLT